MSLNFANAIEIQEPQEVNLDELGRDLPEETIEIETDSETDIDPETTETTKTTETVETEPGDPRDPPGTELATTIDSPLIGDYLATNGFITELPEGINADEFDEDALLKTIEHNIKLRQQEAWSQAIQTEQQRIVSKLSPLAQKVLSYNLDNPNADDGDLESYINSLTAANAVTNLDIEKDANQIVSDYYNKVLGWNNEEVNEKIANLIETDTLANEAKIVKPKLETHVSKLAEQKAREAEAIAEQTRLVNQQLGENVKSLLSKGSLNDIPLSREEAGFIFNALMNNEVPVKLGGKKVEMGYAEAFVLQQKYQGNLENLALGLLVMKDGIKGIEKFIGKKARSKETEAFIRENRFSNNRKKSTTGDNNASYSTGGLNFKM